MFYIKRHYTKDEYEVIDTSNNTSRRMNLVEIQKTLQQGIDVLGAYMNYGIVFAEPYAYKLNKITSKYLMMYNINISIVDDNHVSLVDFTNASFTDKIIIDLLNLGTVIEPYCFFARDISFNGKIIFRLDDLIDFSATSFDNIESRLLYKNVKFDLRGMKNNDKVIKLYRIFYNNFESLKFPMIIDNSDRFKLMLSRILVEDGIDLDYTYIFDNNDKNLKIRILSSMIRLYTRHINKLLSSDFSDLKILNETLNDDFFYNSLKDLYIKIIKSVKKDYVSILSIILRGYNKSKDYKMLHNCYKVMLFYSYDSNYFNSKNISGLSDFILNFENLGNKLISIIEKDFS